MMGELMKILKGPASLVFEVLVIMSQRDVREFLWKAGKSR